MDAEHKEGLILIAKTLATIAEILNDLNKKAEVSNKLLENLCDKMTKPNVNVR